MVHEVRIRRSAAEILALSALAMLVVVVPLVPGRLILGKVPIDAVTLAVPLALAAAYPFLRKLGPRRLPSLLLEVPALAFLAVAAVGVLFALDRTGSALTLARYAAYFALAAVVAAVCVRPANRRALAWAAAGGAAVTVVQAAVQYLHPSGTETSFGFSEAVAARVVGSFGNPNPYAEYLVVVLAIVAALVLTERKAWRVAAGVVLAGSLVALALTYTRGSWLALLAGVLVASAIVDIRWFAAFAAGGAALLALVPGGLQRLASAFTVQGGASARVPLWKLALQMIRLHPVTGVGLGGYRKALIAQVHETPSMLPTGVLPFTAHDSYLMMTAETGVPGGLVFVWLIGRALRVCGIYAVRLGRGSTDWLRHAAFTAGIVGFSANAVTNNAFQDPRGATMFWVLTGLMAANGAVAVAGRAGGEGTAGDESAPVAAARPGIAGALWSLPRTRGRLLIDSPVGALVLGAGAPETDETLDAWNGVA